MDIAGVVAAFATELSVTDLLVPEFSPKPIATAASPAVTHMTARLIEVLLPVRNWGRELWSGKPGRCVSYFTLRIIVYFDGNNKGPLLSARFMDKRRPRRSAHHAGEFLAPSIAGDFADKAALKKSRRSGTKGAFNGEVTRQRNQ